MDMKKSMQNKSSVEMFIKLVVTPIKVSQRDSNRSSCVENQQPYDNNLYEVYLGDTNVTPQAPTNIKYENISSIENSSDQRILPKILTTAHVEQEQEDHLNTFRQFNIKSLDNLLDNIFTKQQHHNGECPDENKYDVDANILLPKNNIIDDNYEIELTKSPTFNILNAPNRVTVKGKFSHGTLDVKLFWSNEIKMANPENESLLGQKVFGLMYCFTLTLIGDADKGLAVRYMHWNETEKHLLAVASVAVWSTKNQHTPERFYEFNTSAIKCLKFSIKTPNNLAIGFDCGKILIVDISKKSLNIVFQTSSKLSLIQEELPEKNFDESKTSKSVFRVTKFIELDQNADLVGTMDSFVYSFLYDDLMTHPKKIVSHFGIIKSLEKSPFSQDVYLTTGCDCNINIWISDVFLESVITLSAGKQIEEAFWSRTCSTIISSVSSFLFFTMDSEFSDSSDDISSNQRTFKKRVKKGRERDVLKKLRATTHELGPKCKCKRYRCFENVSDEDKKRIIKEFNSLGRGVLGIKM
ncbi:hypothetical protein QTP88_019581 [Uroleucon formosanum]